MQKHRKLTKSAIQNKQVKHSNKQVKALKTHWRHQTFFDFSSFRIVEVSLNFWHFEFYYIFELSNFKQCLQTRSTATTGVETWDVFQDSTRKECNAAIYELHSSSFDVRATAQGQKDSEECLWIATPQHRPWILVGRSGEKIHEERHQQLGLKSFSVNVSNCFAGVLRSCRCANGRCADSSACTCRAECSVPENTLMSDPMG